jgi:hypothetical protein
MSFKFCLYIAICFLKTAQDLYGYPAQLSAEIYLVFEISSTKISCAPASVNSSITVAILFFSTIELTATQDPSPSNALTVGALFPGVIFVAAVSFVRSMLYWQRTCFCAAVENKQMNKMGQKELTDDASYSRRDQINHR